MSENNNLKVPNGTNKKITKDDNLAQIIDTYPGIDEILLDYGLHCVGCALNVFDSIQAGCEIHEMDQEEIDELVERLNEFVETGE